MTVRGPKMGGFYNIAQQKTPIVKKYCMMFLRHEKATPQEVGKNFVVKKHNTVHNGYSKYS